jgi:hypothetical protein
LLLTKTLLVTTVAATAVAGATVLTAGAADAAPTVAGTYNTVPAKRVLDTRAGTGAAKAAVGAMKSVTFDAVTPLKTKLVSAEALTITALAPAGAGYLVAYPAGTTRPGTSTVNFNRGGTASNAAIVRPGTSGKITIYNGSAHAINIVADLSGYWTGGSVAADTAGAYNPVPSTRLVDTRRSSPIAPLGDRSVPVAGSAGVPKSNVGAVAVNLTVTTPTGRGFIDATANASDQQGSGSRTADVSFSPGRVASDLVVVPVDPDTGAISLFNGSTAPTNVVVDVVGYFTGGTPSADGAFVASTPYRNSDTRTGAPIAARTTRKIQLGVGGSPSLFKAVVATVSVVNQRSYGYLTAWNGSGNRPGTSSLNFVAGTATSVTVIVPLNADGSFSVFNGSAGSLNLVVDVHGFVLNDVSGTPAQVRAHVRTALAHAKSSAASRLAS